MWASECGSRSVSRRLNWDEPHPNGENPDEPLGKRLRKISMKK